MKRQVLGILLLLTSLCISCEKDEKVNPTDVFEVTTAGVGIDCGLILIAFNPDDGARIEGITNSKTLRYQAYNLDSDEFSKAGQVLIVTIRKTLDSELFPCTTLGYSDPWVTVLDAKPKE